MNFKVPSKLRYSMTVYTLLSWMVLPYILMVGPPYVDLHLPQEQPVAAQTVRNYCSALSDPVPATNIL